MIQIKNYDSEQTQGIREKNKRILRHLSWECHAMSFFTLAIYHIPEDESSSQSFARALSTDPNKAILVSIRIWVRHGDCYNTA